MGRTRHILYPLLFLVLWSWLAYSNFPKDLTLDAGLIDGLLDLSVVVPLALVPLTLVDIWKFLTAERVENVVNPHFILKAEQSTLSRIVFAFMSFAYIGAGLWHLARNGWSWSWSAGMNAPIISALFVVLGGFLVSIAAFSPSIRIAMSPQGLEYSLMRPPWVSWHDITGIKLHSAYTNSYVVLSLKDSTEFRSANLLSRWRCVSKITIMPSMFGLDGETLEKAIDIRHNVFTF